MPAVHTLELHFPLPAYLSPDLVIQHLQACEPLITVNPYLVGFARRPTDLADVVADPFFTEDGQKIDSFEITDRIPIIPQLGLSKEVKVPAIFQSFSSGVRLRADASGGVRVWSTYGVERRHPGAEPGDWELVEKSRVECNAMLKPFVVKSFEATHQTNCQRLIDDLKRKTSKDHPRKPEETPVMAPKAAVVAS